MVETRRRELGSGCLNCGEQSQAVQTAAKLYANDLKARFPRVMDASHAEWSHNFLYVQCLPLAGQSTGLVQAEQRGCFLQPEVGGVDVHLQGGFIDSY